MEKRFFLALSLSFLVLFAYSSVFQKAQPVFNEQVTKNEAIKPIIEERRILPQPPVVVDAPIGKNEIKHNAFNKNELHTIESDTLRLKFASKGGFLAEAHDKTYGSTLPFKNIGLVSEWAGDDFSVASSGHDFIVFSARLQDGLAVQKRFSLKKNTLSLAISIDSVTDLNKTSYNIFAGSIDAHATKDQMEQRYLEASALFKDATIVRKPVFGLTKPFEFSGNLELAGLRDRYFCAIFLPDKKIKSAWLTNGGQEHNIILALDRGKDSAATLVDEYRIYIGAQDEKQLKVFGSGAERIMSFGTFDAISKLLLFFLVVLHNVVKNWGLSIILVTILVYIALFPLSMKSMLSIKKMQALQPKVEDVRNRLKDNPQKMNIEIMELYKKEKVNPFGGCIPMLLQIPVFFALYQVLSRFISLKGASFLWITDLAEPDRLLRFKQAIPLLGNDLNILPLLVAVSMFFQQKLSSASSSGTSTQMAEQQKIMAVMMPVLFGIMFYKLPSGLVLYWFVNGLLMLVFQWRISKTGMRMPNLALRSR